MSAPKRDNARGQAGKVGKANNSTSVSLEEMAEIVKATLLKGKAVASADFDQQDRPTFIAAIAILQDEIPALRHGWRTVGEHHIDGVRLRQRIYRLRGGC